MRFGGNTVYVLRTEKDIQRKAASTGGRCAFCVGAFVVKDIVVGTDRHNKSRVRHVACALRLCIITQAQVAKAINSLVAKGWVCQPT